jgi:hypothetical protein
VAAAAAEQDLFLERVLVVDLELLLVLQEILQQVELVVLELVAAQVALVEI